MVNEFTAVYERDGEWVIAYCLEVPGANGQGRTVEEARESLIEAIKLILEIRREEALQGIPDDAPREIVRVA
jgi:predicted RNase H-like HicB family nuclease